jgi:hypothetical protein
MQNDVWPILIICQSVANSEKIWIISATIHGG